MISIASPIVIKNLSKSYGDKLILDNISLEIKQGQIFGILGRNGVGKTTLLECLVGLREPNSGDIRILGQDPKNERSTLLQKIGFQPQEAALFQHQTVLETIELFSSFYPKEKPIDEILDMLDLKEMKDKRVKSLSVGQRQRLLVAVALVGDPQILIFDEPTAGLDPQVRLMIWDVFRQLIQQGKTILLSTHYMEEAQQLCDYVAILHDRNIVACDTPDHLIQEYTDFGNRTLEGVFIKLTGNTLRRGVD